MCARARLRVRVFAGIRPRACMRRACVHACMRACMHACVHACVKARLCCRGELESCSRCRMSLHPLRCGSSTFIDTTCRRRPILKCWNAVVAVGCPLAAFACSCAEGVCVDCIVAVSRVCVDCGVMTTVRWSVMIKMSMSVGRDIIPGTMLETHGNGLGCHRYRVVRAAVPRPHEHPTQVLAVIMPHPRSCIAEGRADHC